jgi:hypothetical protein
VSESESMSLIDIEVHLLAGSTAAALSLAVTNMFAVCLRLFVPEPLSMPAPLRRGDRLSVLIEAGEGEAMCTSIGEKQSCISNDGTDAFTATVCARVNGVRVGRPRRVPCPALVRGLSVSKDNCVRFVPRSADMR